jgi:hypothetical protein
MQPASPFLSWTQAAIVSTHFCSCVSLPDANFAPAFWMVLPHFASALARAASPTPAPPPSAGRVH